MRSLAKIVEIHRLSAVRSRSDLFVQAVSWRTVGDIIWTGWPVPPLFG